jgi:two-component system sensor histidine kinase HydH
MTDFPETANRISSRPDRRPLLRYLPRVPSWKGNLVVFSVLIAVALSYFYWQVRHAQDTFLDSVRDNSRVVASVIQLNARSAVLSQELLERIMGTFLGNMARFVDYLNQVEPFSDRELAAFADEAGLAGIRIHQAGGAVTEGPSDWLPKQVSSCRTQSNRLRLVAPRHIYYLAWSPPGRPDGCILIGIAAKRIEQLQQRLGLPRLLDTLSGMGGIRYVRLEPNPDGIVTGWARPEVAFVGDADRRVAETRRPLDNQVLVVGVDAQPFYRRVQLLWREFFIFSALLAALGVFFSWLLHRLQSAYLIQIRTFDRHLAQQREDASLGRAAAAIAHEIRNPLNAISMGLQRIQMEADALAGDHRELVRNMLVAVTRTNGIIADFRRYAGPLQPELSAVDAGEVIRDVLALYQQTCAQQRIAVRSRLETPVLVLADRDLIAEVFENLIKNGIEAMPEGGDLLIGAADGEESVGIWIENSGFTFPPNQADQILSPYFTTKVRGTGLGLPIASRIIAAHGGRLDLSVPRPGVLRTTTILPHPAPQDREKRKGDASHEDSHR